MPLRPYPRAMGGSGRFNNTDRYIALGSTPAALVLTGAQTWACWFRTSKAATQVLVGRYGAGTTAGTAFIIQQSGKVLVTVGDGTNAPVSVTSPISYNDMQWHHVCAVYVPGAQILLYIDGAQVASLAAGVPAACNASSLACAIGARGDGGANFFRGLICDVRIYNTALSAQFVAALAVEGIDAVTPVAAWPLNDGSGTTAAASVGTVPATWHGTLGDQWSTFAPIVGRGSTTHSISVPSRTAVPSRAFASPLPVFPTVDGTTGLVFTAIKEVAAGTPGFSTAGYQSGHLQWADVIPPGVNATYPHGLVLYYPWGETRNFPATADKPYGALVGFVKTANAPAAATLASDFATLANWRYAHMPTLCAADPLAASMVGRGGGRLAGYAGAEATSYTAPKYAYLAASSKPPIAPVTIHQNNPVFIQVDVTKDMFTDPTAYRTFDVTTLPGLDLDVAGGQFVGWAANGRFWFTPATGVSSVDGSKVRTNVVISVDLEANGGTNYFQDPTHWHWMDLNPTAIGATFGGGQGGTALGTYLYLTQWWNGTKLGQLNTAGATGGFLDGTGRADAAANMSNWSVVDPRTIHPLATGYINAGAVADATSGVPRYIVFSPFINANSVANPIALCYDTFLPAGGGFATLGNWSFIDTTSIPTNDPNTPIAQGYQGVIQDNGGYAWLLASPGAAANNPPYLCWNPAFPFGASSSWRAYQSYAAYADKAQRTPPFTCGGGFDPLTNSIYPACWGGLLPDAPPVGVFGVLPLLTPSVPANGAGVPNHS
jgi:hypothetical protein